MIRRFLFFILTFYVTCLAQLHAVQAADLPQPDELVVAILPTYPPFTQLDITGQPAGMFIDVWRLWAKKTGQRITFTTKDWVGTLEALKSGEADIHSGLFYSEKRDRWMDYSQAFYVNSSSFYRRIDGPTPPSGSSLRGMKIGVIKGYLQETFLKEAYSNAIVIPLVDDLELIKALAAGRVDLILSEDPTIENLLTQTGMQGRIGSVGAPVMTNDLYASVLDGRDRLLEKINAGFEQITPREWAEIESRWIKDPSKRFFEGSVKRAVELTA